MKIYYNIGNFVDVIISNNNIHIEDSYEIKDISTMKYILTLLCSKYPTNKVFQRSYISLINEWRVHNLCYSLGILRNRTKDVDLNLPKWYIDIIYFILSPLYLHY